MTVTLLTSRSRAAVAETTVLRLEEVQRHARLIARRVWSNHNPEDLAQRATLRYWQTFGEGRGPASLRGWLRRTLDRLAVNEDAPTHHRREARPLPAALAADDDDADRMLKHMANPAQTVVRRDVVSRVLGRIDSRDLLVVRMRLSGCSTQQVAQNTRSTPIAVAQAYARARRQLKAAIAAEPGLLRVLRSGLPEQVIAPTSARATLTAHTSARSDSPGFLGSRLYYAQGHPSMGGALTG